MKIAEMILKLQALDPNMNVFVNGHDGGFDDADISEPLEVAFNINRQTFSPTALRWMGAHEKYDTEYHGCCKVVKGIVIR